MTPDEATTWARNQVANHMKHMHCLAYQPPTIFKETIHYSDAMARIYFVMGHEYHGKALAFAIISDELTNSAARMTARNLNTTH